ncbi:MAG: hypothetical protein HY272_04895 [Gammaproteobacteria bacterium]|nr:hypothetical protein [Gammaproteobacteria bacterium]
MSTDRFWFGFLEAGDRSAAVLRDDKISTGNPDTFYLFNLSRGEIIEYKRSVVEPKLRTLKNNEKALEEELTAGYALVRANFKPKGNRLAIPEKGGRTRPDTAETNPEDSEDVAVISDDDAVWVDDADS